MGSFLHDFLGLVLEKSVEHHASTMFDKEQLVEAHERSYDHLLQTQSLAEAKFTKTWKSSAGHWRPAVPLRGLAPIRARDLQIGKIHHGRVLFGTLCAHAQKWVAIRTVLEDQHGDAVRLAIYNHSHRTTEDARKTYPKGTKVAVKEPYFKMARDGALILRTDNYETVEILKSFPSSPETVCGSVSDFRSEVDVGKLRAEGNARFKDKDWKGAILCYSNCIDLALSLQTGGGPHSSNVMDALLFSYSNRAEANLKLKEYAQAIEDCDKALQIDSTHVKSIFRKGRALRGLGEYNLACCCQQQALELCPASLEIKSEYQDCKQLNEQNQHGKFDLSSYFLNGCKPEDVPDMLSNYTGPVRVEKSVGCGRGLFVTKQVNVGDILLVENAIALTDCQTEANDIKKVVSEVYSCAMSSPRILKQLLCLTDMEALQVPDMDLFQINDGSWNKFEAGGNSDLDIYALENAMVSNLLLTLIFTEDDYGVLNVEGESRVRDEKCGFWALSSFINHSCFPNAKCMVVGKAMFVLAVREIGIGEEITVSYFSTLIPLEGREAICTGLRFQCDCKRCVVERSLGPRFTRLASSIFNMQFKEPLHAETDTFMEYLVKDALQLEKVIDAAQERNLITLEGKQLIRASFPGIYSVIFELASQYPHLNVPSSLLSLEVEVAEAMDHAVPGSIESFHMFARLVEKAQRKDSRLLSEKATRVAMKFYGRQKGHVLRALLKVKPPWQMVFKHNKLLD